MFDVDELRYRYMALRRLDKMSLPGGSSFAPAERSAEGGTETRKEVRLVFLPSFGAELLVFSVLSSSSSSLHLCAGWRGAVVSVAFPKLRRARPLSTSQLVQELPFITMLSLSSTASRSLLKKISATKTFTGQPHLRLVSSMTTSSSPSKKKDDRREIHSTAYRAADASVDESEVKAAAPSSVMARRFLSTIEVTISKIFPAGFGWQTASVIAGSNFGYAPDSLNFALSTGLGDALGVLGGHMAYYTAKKTLVTSDINLTSELHTGILLGAAAFCSGTAWQPLVNTFQGANLSFAAVFTGTWIGCAAAFYGGLRAGRTILSGPLKYISEPTYENSKNDLSLSVAIGGATGFFVGTDAAYLPDQNFLINVVGIQPGTPDLVGCAIAGSSTSLGFMTAQSGFNVIFPAGKCWND